MPHPGLHPQAAHQLLILQLGIVVGDEFLLPTRPQDPEHPRNLVKLPDPLDDFVHNLAEGPVGSPGGILAGPSAMLLQGRNGAGRRHPAWGSAVVDVLVAGNEFQFVDLPLQHAHGASLDPAGHDGPQVVVPQSSAGMDEGF